MGEAGAAPYLRVDAPDCLSGVGGHSDFAEAAAL